jgi:hypothetical protein
VFDWRLWLELADALLTDEVDEARVRCAVGRAYYAVFNLAREHLVASGRIGGERESPHFVVWNALSKSVDRRERDLARGAKYLHEFRLIADYDAAATWHRSDGRALVDLARRLTGEIDAL